MSAFAHFHIASARPALPSRAVEPIIPGARYPDEPEQAAFGATGRPGKAYARYPIRLKCDDEGGALAA